VETRARILEAAQARFAEHGYDATGVAEICAAARISKGAFYHHFASKQAVCLALLDRWLGDLDGGFQAARDGARDVSHAIDRMAELIQPILQQGQERLPLLFEFWLQARRDPAVWAAAVEPYRRYQVFFADLIRQGIAEGSLKPVDPDVAAQALVSLAVGLLLQGLLDRERADWARTAQASVRIYLQGLQTT
jgi:AcrR family transcriptional regulator